jgi:uncharacterized Ntn-hydrolase superfamily protein
VTFSIVAWDRDADELGLAVASRFLAVGAVVPWLEGGVGAIATQSLANTTFGPHGLALLRDGSTAREALDHLVAADGGRAQRQVGIVDARGNTATFTGDECLPWCGGRTGRGYAVQGNILAGPDVVDAMATSFEESVGSPLANRLADALAAGDAAGGDSRGRQSAALQVVRPGGGYGGFNDRMLDLRSDDHADPVAEVRRLLALHALLTSTTPAEEHLAIEGDLAAELVELLGAVGHPVASRPDGLFTALRAWVGSENLEERWWDQPTLDPVVLEHLRRQAGRT